MYGRRFQILNYRLWPVVVLLVVVINRSVGDCGWAEEGADRASIQEWVEGLDDDRFAAREQAQNQLEQSGIVALDAVAEASQKGSLESSTRAINIMLFWSESSDRSIRVAALERLVTLPDRPKESKIAAGLLADAREEEALEAIVALGGYHTLRPRMQSRLVNRKRLPPQVVIGSDWKGGVEGLKHLSAIRRAPTIGFHSAPIDDTVIEALLELSWVSRFEFYGTPKVSVDAIARLEQRFPKRVYVRSGARMGIQGDLSGSARVSGVLKNSAAEKAGLQVNDLITEFEGEKIQDFTTLTSRIAQQEPGDTVELTIVRNRKPLNVTVKFDRWGLNEAQLANLSDDERAVEKLAPPIRLDRR